MSSKIIASLTIALFLQASYLSFPLVFVILANSSVKTKGNWIFPAAFLLGIALDLLYFKTLGLTSLFFLLFTFAIYTYERKFETDNVSFIFISTFIGSMILFLLLGENRIILKSFLTAIFSVLVSVLWQK